MKTHLLQESYQCQFSDCGKTFTDQSKFKTHQYHHTGEKPFLCTHPGSIFHI